MSSPKISPLSAIVVIRRGLFRALDFPVTRRGEIGKFSKNKGGGGWVNPPEREVTEISNLWWSKKYMRAQIPTTKK